MRYYGITVNILCHHFAGKDWHSIGTFHAKEERAIQGFDIDKLDIFTSFVKVSVFMLTFHFHCGVTRLLSLLSTDDFVQDGTSMLEIFKNPKQGSGNLALPIIIFSVVVPYCSK